MTNQAPSSLVEDALIAGLDEVRQAKTSFEIASKLIGKEIGTGALPPSRHEFNHNLTALAMAVAKQGCVDETLSAFAAAMEAVAINEAWEKTDATKYSGINHKTLTWMRNELHTIAMEESNHSALAWRTFNWVCRIDSDACHAVQRDVFKKSELAMALHRRFGNSSRGGIEMAALKELEKIYDAQRGIHSDVNGDDSIHELSCVNKYVENGVNDDQIYGSLFSGLTENILHAILCDKTAV